MYILISFSYRVREKSGEILQMGQFAVRSDREVVGRYRISPRMLDVSAHPDTFFDEDYFGEAAARIVVTLLRRKSMNRWEEFKGDELNTVYRELYPSHASDVPVLSLRPLLTRKLVVRVKEGGSDAVYRITRALIDDYHASYPVKK